MTQITVDGVIQANGHASEAERAAGFTRDGWAMGVFDDDTGAFITETYQRAAAFLLGRRTFEMFQETWGTVPDMRTHPIGAALLERPKYVASDSALTPTWERSTVLSGDLAAQVAALKAQPGGDLQVHGSGVLIRWLLGAGLIDEMTLLTVPIVLGQGERLFPQDGPDVALELQEVRADAKGVVIQVYRPGGTPDYRPNRFD